jgi:hypothetical protein
MKKIITLIIGFIPLSFAYAQIPNYDFESWNSDNPTNWITSNTIYSTVDFVRNITRPLSVVKTLSGFSGSYAVTLQNVTGTSLGLTKDTLAGIMAVATATGKEGFPISQRYISLNGYYKFVQGGNETNQKFDTASILIGVSRWNENTKSREIIGRSQYSIFLNTSSYTYFNLNIEYNSANIPDSAQISISSSLSKVKYPGTSLTLDKLTFDGVTPLTTAGIRNKLLSETIIVYPNPATEEINFNNIPAEASLIELRDLAGRKIQSIKVSSDLMNIKTNAISSGIYIYSILNESGELIGINKISIEH